MRISYEMNPPRIVRDASFDLDSLKKDLEKFHSRISLLKDLVESIHLTDSVLGIPRISSVSAAADVRKAHGPLKMLCSIRARDRNLSAIMQIVSDAIMTGVDGLLIVKGDKPASHSIDSGLKPSSVARTLREQGFGRKIKLFLSVPCDPTPKAILPKLEAEPYGFITQSISSVEQLQRIVDAVRSHSSGTSILPCIMVPSPKNKRSAEMIELDWSSYAGDADSFIKRAHEICGEVLITSPNSFDEGMHVLGRLGGASRR